MEQNLLEIPKKFKSFYSYSFPKTNRFNMCLTGPFLDQGLCGTSWVFTGCRLLASSVSILLLLAHGKKKYIPLSPQYIIQRICEKNSSHFAIGGNPCSGGNISLFGVGVNGISPLYDYSGSNSETGGQTTFDSIVPYKTDPYTLLAGDCDQCHAAYPSNKAKCKTCCSSCDCSSMGSFPIGTVYSQSKKIKLVNKQIGAGNDKTITSSHIKLDLKGIIASQISECNEIILTEIVTNQFFLELDAAEIVAVLAAFIEEKANDVTEISKLEVTEKVKSVLGDISYIADDFGSYEYNSGIQIESDWQLYLSFIGPAYDWARGKSIYEIYSEYPDVYEGTFIRNILRITNMIENIKNIATMRDQPEILKKLEGVGEVLLRDQVTTESLYISKN